ncbi:MAG: amidohydrolase family protein [Erysipelotrichaceae bacterium]|nr:amidohydrolase family protein [Erysipelotrichaceae bacterium]
MKEKTDLILKADHIFTAESDAPFSGYVAVSGDRITAVGEGEIPEEFLQNEVRCIDLGNRTLCPGFTDVHCFFSGYVMRFVGADLSECISDHQARNVLKDYAVTKTQGPLLGHGLRVRIAQSDLDADFPDRCVIAFMEGCETCCMNTKAIEEFGFTPDRCYPEAYVGLFPYVLGDKDFIKPQFIDYMKMMNSRGITSIKEMGFDDYYGFTDILDELRKNDGLTLRVSFMSQPVARDIDFAYGEAMREKFQGDKVSFSGYNQMTDGSVSEYNAELKELYNGKDFTCAMTIDWDKLCKDAVEADKRGFRFSLHAQGDGAIGKTLDIFEKCQRDENGKVVHRQAITDLEFSDPEDLERMGRLGVTAEIYPQIQSIADRENKTAMIREKIGEKRGRFYWNRRKMADSGVTISCGTDLPLLIDDIPESVYHAVGGFFPEGGEPFNKENMLKLPELLKAWTYGGAYDLGKEEISGTLKVGKKADIAVIDGDLFHTPIDKVRDLKVCLTLCDGKIVYQGE